jgi:hypothetical protein
VFGALPLANAGWDGKVDIQLGETIAAAFVKAPRTEVHRFAFYAPATTVLGAAWKVTFSDNKLTPLVLTVGLYKADGTAVALGLTLDAAKGTIKNFIIPTSGGYYLQVTSTSATPTATGEYSIKTTAKFPSAIKIASTSTGAVDFAALGGSLLSATVKTIKGSANTAPFFRDLLGPSGLVALPPILKRASSKAAVPGSVLKNVLLPASGEYHLGIGGPAGAVTVSGSVVSPKARHVWYLGPVNPPTVTLSRDYASIPEAAGVATFTAALSGITGVEVTVTLGITGTATLTADYTRSGTQIAIPAGASSGSITVTAVQDASKELDETVIVTITAVTPAAITANGVQQQTTTILDDDQVPMIALWQGSGHGDATAMAFNDWNDTNPPLVPKNCARCHSSYGFQDFVGVDGSDNRLDGAYLTPGVFTVAQASAGAAIGSTVDCIACHNEKANALDAVVFPSDRPAVAASGSTPAKPARPAMAIDLGPEARCMQCHQGRESTISVDEHIEVVRAAAAALATPVVVTDDTVAGTLATKLSFKNVHYLSAAATLYGGGAKGAYQYRDGQTDAHLYEGLNPHVPEADSCVECHNPHSLEVEISMCAKCHVSGAKGALTSAEDLKGIRMAGSTADYDGDGNTTEGMYYELSTMADILLAAIQSYASTVAGVAIVYDPAVYPYFAKAAGGTYTSWTPRLLRAAYNYNCYVKEPGNFAHNPKYMVQILYDSIADLAAAGVNVPQLANMHRNDPGHFDGQSMVFRDWDVRTISGQVVDATNDIVRASVSVSCSPCHTNAGFEFWQKYGLNTTVEMPAGDGMECGTCHVGGANTTTGFGAPVPALKVVKTVLFPSPVASPVTITNSTSSPDTSFICMSCHRGRQSGATLDANITAAGTKLLKTPSNVHYLPAGATLYGSDAKVAYMFGDAATYAKKWTHDDASGKKAQCKYCHLTEHTFEPQIKSACTDCHGEVVGDSVETIRRVRGTDSDYNGVNGTTDTMKAEVESFEAALLAQMNVYATAHGFPAVAYADGSFVVATAAGNDYSTTWDATLLRAGFNYNYFQKELGAWAHNYAFTLQILYDSIDKLDDGTLNGSPTTSRTPALTRPPAPTK